MKLKLFLVAVVVMAASLLQAQSVKQIAREVYQNSGMNAMVKMVDAQFASAMNNLKFDQNPNAESIKKSMLKVLSSKNIENALLKQLEEEVPFEELEIAAKFYKDPFIQEFVVLEQSLYQNEKAQELLAFKTQLLSNPPTAERIQLVDQLIKDMNTIETTKQMTLSMTQAILHGGNAILPVEQRMTEEQLNDRIQLSIPANIDVMLTEAVQINSLFVYKDISDEKLTKYTARWQSEEGQIAIRNLMDVFTATFTQIGEQLGKSLASAMK